MGHFGNLALRKGLRVNTDLLTLNYSRVMLCALCAYVVFPWYNASNHSQSSSNLFTLHILCVCATGKTILSMQPI